MDLFQLTLGWVVYVALHSLLAALPVKAWGTVRGSGGIPRGGKRHLRRQYVWARDFRYDYVKINADYRS